MRIGIPSWGDRVFAAVFDVAPAAVLVAVILYVRRQPKGSGGPPGPARLAS